MHCITKQCTSHHRIALSTVQCIAACRPRWPTPSPAVAMHPPSSMHFREFIYSIRAVQLQLTALQYSTGECSIYSILAKLFRQAPADPASPGGCPWARAPTGHRCISVFKSAFLYLCTREAIHTLFILPGARFLIVDLLIGSHSLWAANSWLYSKWG
jgi:hypothetical protein